MFGELWRRLKDVEICWSCRRYLENSGVVGHTGLLGDSWITLMFFGVPCRTLVLFEDLSRT